MLRIDRIVFLSTTKKMQLYQIMIHTEILHCHSPEIAEHLLILGLFNDAVSTAWVI